MTELHVAGKDGEIIAKVATDPYSVKYVHSDDPQLQRVLSDPSGWTTMDTAPPPEGDDLAKEKEVPADPADVLEILAARVRQAGYGAEVKK